MPLGWHSGLNPGPTPEDIAARSQVCPCRILHDVCSNSLQFVHTSDDPIVILIQPETTVPLKESVGQMAGPRLPVLQDSLEFPGCEGEQESVDVIGHYRESVQNKPLAVVESESALEHVRQIGFS